MSATRCAEGREPGSRSRRGCQCAGGDGHEMIVTESIPVSHDHCDKPRRELQSRESAQNGDPGTSEELAHLRRLPCRRGI